MGVLPCKRLKNMKSQTFRVSEYEQPLNMEQLTAECKDGKSAVCSPVTAAAVPLVMRRLLLCTQGTLLLYR